MTTLAITRTHRHTWSDIHVWAGVATGVIASLVMGMLVMGVTLVQGRGLFLVPEKIATLVLSDTAAATTGGILTGLGIHMMLGAAFGVIFAGAYAFLTSRYDVGGAVGLGLLFGFGLWVANFLILGPAVGAQLTAAIGAGVAIPTHLAFGAVLGLYPLLLKETEGK